MRSIRRFLIIVLLAAVTLINFLAALHGYRSSLAAAEKLFDNELLQFASILFDYDSSVQPTFAESRVTGIAYQVWEGGVLTQRSLNAPASAMAPLQDGFHEVNFANARWRVVAFGREQPNSRWVFVAEQINNRFILAEDVIVGSVIPLVLCVPLIGLLIWLIVTWGLLPLQKLAAQLEEKHPEDLSPISNLAETKELKQLVYSVNDLLSRLSGALERETRFAANAAHELRTPLSVLKVYLYNLRQQPLQDFKDIEQLELGLNRLSHLVEQILALHLSSQDRHNIVLKPLDLLSVCRHAISDNFPLFALKQQDIELIGEEPRWINANAKSLHIMLDNLLTNASKYSPPQSKVRVTVSVDGKQCILCVEDSGPGIPESERDHVFERFYRVGGDHHSSGELGCGLGLSVVKQVVENHNASIALGSSSELGGLCVAIRFPLVE